MNVHLFFHDLGYVIDLLVAIFIVTLISFKARSGTSKVMLLITWASVIVFVISHMLGVSVADGELSRKILMFNLIDIFLPLSTAHSVFALLGKAKQQRKVLIASYSVAFFLLFFFLFNPSLFLHTSVPKLYFPNYYVAGPCYWLMLLFFFSLSLYFLLWMRQEYYAADGIEKNRIKYFLLSLLFGYGFGSIDFLLVYNIPADPLWGALFVPLFSIPFIYAALQYELMDISVVAKKAFVYTLTAGAIGVVLSILNYINDIIIRTYPAFPDWASSIIFALFSAIAVLLIWSKLREADVLKYEFMNVVTHKFRTPLTSIKWSAEDMRENAPVLLKEDIQQIQTANDRLVELTNLLVNLSGTDDKSYEYVFLKVDATEVIDSCVDEAMKKAQEKGVVIEHEVESGVHISADQQKIKFVFQTLLDNAVSYSGPQGKIILKAHTTTSRLGGDKLIVTVSDNGIGIPKDEIKYIFTKFYRAKNGRKADTEGMGIGLYLSKHIVDHHKGKMWVESAGEGKGTMFTITLPLVK